MARSTTGSAYLIFGLVVLGSLVFTIFVTVPKISGLNEARNNRQAAIGERKEREDFLASLEERKAELDNYTSDAKALSVALPTSFSQADLLSEIDNAASSSGVTIQKVSESQKSNASTSAATAQETETSATEGSKTEYYDTQLEIRGSYAQVRAFIKELETSILFTDVMNVEISAAAESAEVPGSLAAKLTIRNYIQP